MSTTPVAARSAGPSIPLSRRVDPTALTTLFGMTVARLIRGRRLVVLSVLFALPILFAVLAQQVPENYHAIGAEVALVFALVPQTLLPLTALVFASGLIQDEVEEQTLTYLLIRPLPRSLIYIVKLLATWSVTSVLTFGFLMITFVAVYEFDASSLHSIFPARALITAAAMILALSTYVAVFGLISLFLRKTTLVAGVAYIILLEGVLANVDIVVRKLTVMYQFRIITVRSLELNASQWNIVLPTAPSTLWAVLNLLIATVVLTILGAVTFSLREFRVKTPEAA